jgi:hypothetical protein
MKRSFEIKAQTGVIKKVVQMETKTSEGKKMAFIPKVTGKLLKTFVTDSMKTRGPGKTTSPIVSRKQPKETLLAQRKPGTVRKGGVRNA